MKLIKYKNIFFIGILSFSFELNGGELLSKLLQNNFFIYSSFGTELLIIILSSII